MTEVKIPENLGIEKFWFDLYELGCISAADELGLFDTLLEGPKTAKQMSIDLSTDLEITIRICKILVSRFFLVSENNSFRLTEESLAYWTKHSPLYRGPSFQSRRTGAVHKRIVLAAKNGWSPHIDGSQSLGEQWLNGTVSDSSASDFTASMHLMMLAPAIAVARSRVFQGTTHLLDLGGGSGVFAVAFAAHFQKSVATVLELPAVCPLAQKLILQHELSERVQTLSANFFTDDWPHLLQSKNIDSVLLSNVLHDWTVDKCRQLLTQCYQTLPRNGRIFIHENLLNDDRLGPHSAIVFDLIIRMSHRGQQFSLSELKILLEEVGFIDISIVHRFGNYSLIQGQKL